MKSIFLLILRGIVPMKTEMRAFSLVLVRGWLLRTLSQIRKMMIHVQSSSVE